MPRTHSIKKQYRQAQFETCEPRLMMASDFRANSSYAADVEGWSRSTGVRLGEFGLRRSATGTINTVGDDDYFRFTALRTGTVTVRITPEAGLRTQLHRLYANLSPRIVNGNELKMTVKANDSYDIRVRGVSNTGDYSLALQLQPKAVDLAHVENMVLRQERISGEKWYKFCATHNGDVRAESWIKQQTKNVRLELYDAEFNRLANMDARYKDDLDVESAANDVFYLRVAGSNSAVKLRLTNSRHVVAEPILQGSQKLVGYIGIGNGEITDVNPRGINYDQIPNGDWAAMYANRCEPLAAMGLRRWALWMPFGRDPERMHTFSNNGVEFDLASNLRIEQYSLARASGLYETLCDGFVEATRNFREAGPDREVIAYLGTIIDAPEWMPDGSVDPSSPNSIEGHRARMDAELAPYVEAGCSLAFDATALLSEEHWFFTYIQELQQSGVRVYIEGWPYASTPHLANFSAISLIGQLANYHEEHLGPTGTINPPDGFNGFLDPDLITGDRQAWLVDHKPDSQASYATWYRTEIPALLANPWIDSVAFYAGYFVQAGGKFEELDTDMLVQLGNSANA